jgi:predicted nicotinamide N-methyase
VPCNNPAVSNDRAEFVRAHTRLAPVAHVPEIRLYQAEEPIGLWELTEGEYSSAQPPPFWAFAWSGGQGLARYLLDHPATVAGARVLDLAAGSGIVAIAAVLAGAAAVRAVDVDATAIASIRLNARANSVVVAAEQADILEADHGDAGVVVAGDVFYSGPMAERVFGFLRQAARTGARVLVGDPDRAFLPRPYFDPLASYDVPVTVALESATVRRTTVWRLRPPAPHGRPARQLWRSHTARGIGTYDPDRYLTGHLTSETEVRHEPTCGAGCGHGRNDGRQQAATPAGPGRVADHHR